MTTIVVGVDGSDPAREALAWAVTEARLRRARLTIVHSLEYPYAGHAYEPDPSGWSSGAMAQPNLTHLEDAAQAVLGEAVAAAHDQDPDLDVAGHLGHGSPAGALLEAAADAELVVVGARGLGGFTGLWLGSVSRQVAHHSPRPVAIIRLPRPAPAPAHGRMMVGVDGSSASVQALRFALDEASLREADLQVMHAWTFPVLTILPFTRDVPTPEQLAEAARALIARCLDDAGGPGEVNVDYVVSHENAARALIDAAGEVDVLVVGARGAGGFGGLLVGSVADACARHARVPVIVVPAAAP